ncbi:hypothetical protein, partial [Paenibacillus massiliensis]|uniref:hypothetical protein n=1 Tax=Paenibacillus massiliensis TaxID=225917 RepID=UPI000568AA11
MMDIHPQVLQGKGRTHGLLIQFERVWLSVISQQKKLCTSHMGDPLCLVHSFLVVGRSDACTSLCPLITIGLGYAALAALKEGYR